MKVLVITTDPDPHVDMVQKHLDNQIIRFDPCEFPFNTDVTYVWNGFKFDIYSKNQSFSGVDVVWYRKPRLLKVSELPVDPMYQHFAFSAYKRTVQALYGLLQDKMWVSDPWMIFRAENKLHQLECAAVYGFRVPQTLITSSPNDAEKFRKNVGKIITKTMGNEFVVIDGKPYNFYTTRIAPDEVIDFSGLRISPAIFQEEVTKGVDVRVTVVGDQVFPCEIQQKGTMLGEIDWRSGIGGLDLIYISHDRLPSDLAEKCIRLVQGMGLKFGAIDLILDPQGNYWFMEINPNGQWGFVEEETGVPISKAMAALFRADNQTLNGS